MRDSAKTGVLKLTVAFLFVIQTGLLQAEDFAFTNKGGQITITKYIGSGGAVTLPEKIDGLPVTGIGRSAFNRCATITSIVIPRSVSTVERNAFAGCTGLTNISFNSGFVSFEPDIFTGCDGLKSLTLPNCKINPNALDGFMGGKNIARVSIPHSVTNFGGAQFFEQNIFYPEIIVDPKNPVYSSSKEGFFNKDKTVLIHCPSGIDGQYVVPPSVRIISGAAFSGCEKLTSISIPSTVTNIEPDAFTICPHVSSLVVDNTNAVYSSSQGVLFNKDKTMLLRCPEGKAGDYAVPSSVTCLGPNAFYCCSELTGVSMGKGITSIEGGTFSSCTKLVGVTIPSSVTNIADHAFSMCSALTNVVFEGKQPHIGLKAFVGGPANDKFGETRSGKVSRRPVRGSGPGSLPPIMRSTRQEQTEKVIPAR